MALITADDVKAKWTRWEVFCQPTDAGDTADDVLDSIIEDAETEMLEYLPTLTDEIITDQLTRHLVIIIKYGGFLNLHGEADFETKPRMVADYEATLKMLGRYRAGEFPVPDDGEEDDGEEHVKFSGKARAMDEWFTPVYPPATTS